MKFTCLQENLLKALSTANKAVTSKSSLPVLSCVLIKTENGKLKFSTTNLETSVSTWIGASIEKEGSVCIPARILYEFVSNLPPVNVTGEVDGNFLNLVSSKASSKFNGMDYQEFPTLNEDFKDIHLLVDPKSFSEAVLETAFAAAADESRPILTGVLMYLDSGKLFLVGVDGFRLAEKTMVVPEKAVKKDFSAVVPAKTLLEVARLVSSSKDPVAISLNTDGNLLMFKSSDALISSHLLEGDFPEYKKLIPKSSKENIKITLPTSEFANALKLANVFSKDAVSVVKMRMSPKEGAVFISATNSEVGENESRIDAVVEGNELEALFNSKFFLDVLNNVKSEEFVFELPSNLGPGTPSILRPIGRDDHTYLVMPMQGS